MYSTAMRKSVKLLIKCSMVDGMHRDSSRASFVPYRSGEMLYVDYTARSVAQKENIATFSTSSEIPVVPFAELIVTSQSSLLHRPGGAHGMRGDDILEVDQEAGKDITAGDVHTREVEREREGVDLARGGGDREMTAVADDIGALLSTEDTPILHTPILHTGLRGDTREGVTVRREKIQQDMWIQILTLVKVEP